MSIHACIPQMLRRWDGIQTSRLLKLCEFIQTDFEDIQQHVRQCSHECVRACMLACVCACGASQQSTRVCGFSRCRECRHKNARRSSRSVCPSCAACGRRRPSTKLIDGTAAATPSAHVRAPACTHGSSRCSTLGLPLPPVWLTLGFGPTHINGQPSLTFLTQNSTFSPPGIIFCSSANTSKMLETLKSGIAATAAAVSADGSRQEAPASTEPAVAYKPQHCEASRLQQPSTLGLMMTDSRRTPVLDMNSASWQRADADTSLQLEHLAAQPPRPGRAVGQQASYKSVLS